MASEQHCWSGEERRSIPIHILNHMEEKLDEHMKSVKNLIEEHASEEIVRAAEMQRSYDDIVAAIAKLTNNQTAMSASLGKFMEKTDELYENVKLAFPKDKNGRPDFGGHAADHEFRIENADQYKKIMTYIEAKMEEEGMALEDRRFYKRIAVGAIITPFVIWVSTLIWQGALQGPQHPPVKESGK